MALCAAASVQMLTALCLYGAFHYGGASSPFLSWLIGFGNKAKIISPPWVIDEMEALMAEVASQYE